MFSRSKQSRFSQQKLAWLKRSPPIVCITNQPFYGKNEKENKHGWNLLLKTLRVEVLRVWKFPPSYVTQEQTLWSCNCRVYKLKAQLTRGMLSSVTCVKHNFKFCNVFSLNTCIYYKTVLNDFLISPFIKSLVPLNFIATSMNQSISFGTAHSNRLGLCF